MGGVPRCPVTLRPATKGSVNVRALTHSRAGQRRHFPNVIKSVRCRRWKVRVLSEAGARVEGSSESGGAGRGGHVGVVLARCRDGPVTWGPWLLVVANFLSTVRRCGVDCAIHTMGLEPWPGSLGEAGLGHETERTAPLAAWSRTVEGSGVVDTCSWGLSSVDSSPCHRLAHVCVTLDKWLSAPPPPLSPSPSVEVAVTAPEVGDTRGEPTTWDSPGTP